MSAVGIGEFRYGMGPSTTDHEFSCEFGEGHGRRANPLLRMRFLFFLA